MEYLFLLIMLLSGNVFSCVVGPAQKEISEEFGFTYEEKSSEFDEGTNKIFITAPLSYEGQKFSLGVFTVFLNGQVVSKSDHSYINQQSLPEFLGYVGNGQGFSYSVSFLYGEGRCSVYEFTTKSATAKPYKAINYAPAAPLLRSSHLSGR